MVNIYVFGNATLLTSYAVHCAYGKKIKTLEWQVRASAYLIPAFV